MEEILKILQEKRKQLNIPLLPQNLKSQKKIIEDKVAALKEVAIKNNKILKPENEIIYKVIAIEKIKNIEIKEDKNKILIKNQNKNSKLILQKISDQEFRKNYIKEIKGEHFNSQKIEIIFDYLSENFSWLCLSEYFYRIKKVFLSESFKYTLIDLKIINDSILPIISIEDNRVLLN